MDIKLAREDHQAIYDKVKPYPQLDIAYEEGQSLLIFGDNLRVLKTLIESRGLRHKVDLVYIDPPFSTKTTFRVGTERTATISSSKQSEVAYADHLTGEAYLDFIRQRLVLLKEIMSPDASIYLHIDYKIGHYIKILMDEVFGTNAFKADITRIKSNPKNFSRRTYGNIKDVVLYYALGNYTWNDPRQSYSEADVEKLFPKIDANGERYTTNPLHAPGESSGVTGKPWNGISPPEGRHWRVPPAELDKLEAVGLIEWSKNGVPRKKIYAKDRVISGKKMQDIWEFKDPQYPVYPTQKSLNLLEHIVSTSSNPGDLVLDCFCGSGTTMLAAKKLARNWIGIDDSKSAIKVSKMRLEK